MNTLTDSKALKILNKMIDDVNRNGIIINTVIDDLTALRPYTITGEFPLLAKATRLALEHLEKHESFDVAIPCDEPIDDANDVITEVINGNESFYYFLCLIRDVNKAANEVDLREYVAVLANA